MLQGAKLKHSDKTVVSRPYRYNASTFGDPYSPMTSNEPKSLVICDHYGRSSCCYFFTFILNLRGILSIINRSGINWDRILYLWEHLRTIHKSSPKSFLHSYACHLEVSGGPRLWKHPLVQFIKHWMNSNYARIPLPKWPRGYL